MSPQRQFEEVLRSVQSFDRDACKTRLRSLDELSLDFTDDFLDSLTLDRLRHLLIAAWLQARKRHGGPGLKNAG
ncbi:MAG TPA: hypothetical protein VGC81_02140 [Candidatus Methylomirabilis sp.]